MASRIQPATVPATDGLLTGGGGGGGTTTVTAPDTIALGVNAAGAPRVLRRTAGGVYQIDTPPSGIFPPAAQDRETVTARSVSDAGITLGWVEIRRLDGAVDDIVDFGTDTAHVEDADHDHYEPWPPADASSTGSEMHHVVLNHGDTWSPAADMAAGSVLRSVQIDVLEGAASITDSAGNAVAYTEMGITVSDPAGVDIGQIDSDETLPGMGARVLVIWQEVPAP